MVTSDAALLGLLALAFGGCISHSYTNTAPTPFPPKSDGCDFALSTAGAPAGYQEIGTVGGCSGTYDLSAYKAQIAHLVCGAGGDLVVAQVNGNGVYCLGTVFRKQQ
jgi:hypothetical protein